MTLRLAISGFGRIGRLTMRALQELKRDDMEIVLITPDGLVAAFLRVANQDDSEITGPAFSPDGKRMYFSSQRGPANRSLGDALGIENDSTHIGITYEVTGPFRRS